ncbi:MAG: uroporphyrinogen-III C-methyltransferase [Nitrospirae bacterium]|nr:uroporphyrinogen-III C-methyltransferase [Nitrospirota bacterium]
MKIKEIGKVYLVGAGPGDIGLFTLKGKECVEKADVIIYDYLANANILSFARPETECIFVGKHGGKSIMPQEEINRLMIRKASAGHTVVRLKGGDPFIFGRGGEEAENLSIAGIPFDIVPGVTSAIAVPALAGIPLTHRKYSSNIGIVTGHEYTLNKNSAMAWDKLATGVDTLVILMGITNLSFIVNKIIKHGRSPATPAAVIQWGTTPDQITVTGTLGNIVRRSNAEQIRPPAIIVIGDVVRLRPRLTTISYASVRTDNPMGEVFVAATHEGVCRISFGNERSFLKEIKSIYKDSLILKDEQQLMPVLSELGNYFSGHTTKFTFKLNLTGTDFQKLVWKELLNIPYGKTASYKDVAIMIGKPHAVRAVGGACGKNPIPIVIPCHRVISADGNIGGYSGGPGIKMALLKIEGIK